LWLSLAYSDVEANKGTNETHTPRVFFTMTKFKLFIGIPAS